MIKIIGFQMLNFTEEKYWIKLVAYMKKEVFVYLQTVV